MSLEDKKEGEFVNPIDKDKVAENPGLLPYAHHAGSALIKPEDMGKAKSRALMAMEQQTDLQYRQLQRQIELLAKQAQELKNRVEISQQIYNCEMGFEPLISHTYHLYRREDEKLFLSMVAPNEWGRTKKSHEHIATVKMLADHTWEIISNTNNNEYF